MDPVTTAIIAAIAAGISTGVPKLLEKTISDAYDGLKALLKRKFGHDSGLVKAVDELEAEPESEGRKVILKEKVAHSKAADDADILKAAQELLDKLNAAPGGSQIVQTATGSYIAQAAQGSKASVKVNQPGAKSS
ncbi:MAG TPA: hypothetical protein VH640_29725 [Bryobacteraceae bacterium]|jgi:hypothetical protein